MTPEEQEANRTAKMGEYAKQSQEEREARWANNNGKLSQEAWDQIQQMKPEERKQAMLQAGIDKLDSDDPRRAQLEKIEHWMGNKDAVTPGSQPPSGETNNLLTKAGRTGGSDEAQLEPGETRCGEVAGQMLNFTKGDKAPGLPPGAYFNTEACEADDKNATPGSGDVFHLRNEAKGGNAADDMDTPRCSSSRPPMARSGSRSMEVRVRPMAKSRRSLCRCATYRWTRKAGPWSRVRISRRVTRQTTDPEPFPRDGTTRRCTRSTCHLLNRPNRLVPGNAITTH
jgi:hypothetical protein